MDRLMKRCQGFVEQSLQLLGESGLIKPVEQEQRLLVRVVIAGLVQIGQ